jgi:hypothetical protein
VLDQHDHRRVAARELLGLAGVVGAEPAMAAIDRFGRLAADAAEAVPLAASSQASSSRRCEARSNSGSESGLILAGLVREGLDSGIWHISLCAAPVIVGNRTPA